ncbi:KH domain-containing, RNA-binding, signal transduction-associated protein 3-like isoform X2 [Leguminivora glycinivorella]|uniref:KH domain-containing, RNA-binding, signal transduction-associated protein 3-like isoform X2 n=1 Tax=Leguminivora glycinivorella TaxID=1035111 RepID=UPI00200DB801|nr:KH domain-containing, RNA-binding, signal transduction-associated protein 3-like isoform X2 [Leguminivora glycinivorella]
MESGLPASDADDGPPGSSGSGSSSGTGYYHKNGEWRGERRLLDITRDKPVKLCVRVAVPVRDHPKFNFVGKLLGPKGNSLKRLQEDTLCKMAVLGRGSMKDRQKEEELRVSGDPKFSHLAEELHVEVSAFATPAEAHARVAYALAELRRFLVPDYNDDIRQEQMLEMQLLAQAPRSPPAASPRPTRLSPAPEEHKHRAAGLACAPLGGATRDYSPPLPAAPDHQHHQLAASHGVLMGGVLPPHLLHNSILGAAGAATGAVGRKRPLLGAARTNMSPTKRAVITLLARARAAAHRRPPAWRHEHGALLPLLREEFAAAAGAPRVNLA